MTRLADGMLLYHGSFTQINDKVREACAIETMCRMLCSYAQQHEISFESAFFPFSISPIYTALFDYSTAIWKEGPDYLQCLFEEYLGENRE